MTAQITETLIIDGQPESMMSTPLGDYFEMLPNSPQFEASCTALWRGYVGTWQIINDRLYLIEINGTLKGGEPATLAALFPGFPERVFAHWFSGQVRLPQGKRLSYRHMGFGSTYERDHFIVFRKGIVVGQHTVVNGVAPNDATTHTGPDALTVFQRERHD